VRRRAAVRVPHQRCVRRRATARLPRACAETVRAAGEEAAAQPYHRPAPARAQVTVGGRARGKVRRGRRSGGRATFAPLAPRLGLPGSRAPARARAAVSPICRRSAESKSFPRHRGRGRTRTDAACCPDRPAARRGVERGGAQAAGWGGTGCGARPKRRCTPRRARARSSRARRARGVSRQQCAVSPRATDSEAGAAPEPRAPRPPRPRPAVRPSAPASPAAPPVRLLRFWRHPPATPPPLRPPPPPATPQAPTAARRRSADRHGEARAPVSSGPRGRETHDAIRELRRVSGAPHAVSAPRPPRGAPPMRARGETRRRVVREVGGIMEIDPDRNLGGEAR
jgi:hypothetical protein